MAQEYFDKYIAIAIQPEIRSQFVTRKSSKDQIKENLERHCKLIDREVRIAREEAGLMEPKLVVFPECFLHGFPPSLTANFKQAEEMTIRIPGEETDTLGEKCKQYGLYLVGTAFEHDPEYPDHQFNTGFIIDPNGEVVLKYRKVNTSNNDLEFSASPCDVLEKYGNDPKKIFPVVKTPIGNLGVYICYDGTMPEVARCLALNGAEILCRPNYWPFTDVQKLDFLKLHNRARAHENSCYVVTADWPNSPYSSWDGAGGSMIVDFLGNIVAAPISNSPCSIWSMINLRELREKRQMGGFANFITQLRTEVYAEAYRRVTCFPPNKYLERNQGNLEEKYQMYEQVIERLTKEGVLTPP